MENALEITIIGVLGGIIAALIALGGVGFFWLASRIDRLAEQNNTTHNELNEKINQSHSDLIEKINQSHNELIEKIDQSHNDLVARMEQMKSEIISALLNHTHPEPGGPPLFTAPPPAIPSAPLPPEPEPTPATADN